MILYRIARKDHIQDLSGMGAMLFGGRWNRQGIRALYAAGSVSLAMLEVIANSGSDKVNAGLHLAEIHFPDETDISTIDKLPEHWNSFPYTGKTVSIGSQFLKSGGFCLKVPSALVPSEFNYIINPLHEKFTGVSILDTRPLIFDQRLMK